MTFRPVQPGDYSTGADTTRVGTLTARCLGPEATEALASDALARETGVPPRHGRRRSSHQRENEAVDARLARLGLGAYTRKLQSPVGFRAVDLPLG